MISPTVCMAHDEDIFVAPCSNGKTIEFRNGMSRIVELMNGINNRISSCCMDEWHPSAEMHKREEQENEALICRSSHSWGVTKCPQCLLTVVRRFCGLSACHWHFGLSRGNLGCWTHQQVALSTVSFAAAKLSNRA